MQASYWVRICVLAFASLVAVVPARAAEPIAQTSPGAAPAIFATVGGVVITTEEYRRALVVAMRSKYYHATPPEAEYASFQRTVADELVNRVLLLAEARRRGIEPDSKKIQATVAGYDAKYGTSANWKTNRDKMLAAVIPQLENDSRLERLEQLIRTVPVPTEIRARSYFEQHQDLFVEPEQVKLSVILLKVEPSANQPVWDAANAEGRRLHGQLMAGADFAELARLHSSDRSAAGGGAMEYTHRGMLPEAVQGVVDKLKPGAIAEPVQLLEGVVILRLDGRRAAKQRTFEQVRERAGGLWQRAEADARWQQLIAELRRATAIRIDESKYVPLRAPGDKARAG